MKTVSSYQTFRLKTKVSYLKKYGKFYKIVTKFIDPKKINDNYIYLEDY